jgi:hypothetical protein
MIYPETPEQHHVTGAPLLAWDHAARAWVELPADMPAWEQAHEHHYSAHQRIIERWERRIVELRDEPNEHRRRDLHRRICRLGGLWWDAFRKSFEVVL